MKTYEWILFDADDTLFYFDAFRGLQLMFLQFGITFTELDYAEYKILNKSLWVDYQNGKIVAQQLQHRRFEAWANKLQLTTQLLSSAYLAAMAEICAPMPGAISLLDSLKGQVKLGIITNGFTDLQYVRLERIGLKNHIDLLVISEQVGVAKPHPQIFEHALALMGNPAREKVLMVGDNPDTDILGGINAGFDTCWLNVDNKPLPEGVKPLYQVTSLIQLELLLMANK